jgi:hypothetical protein
MIALLFALACHPAGEPQPSVAPAEATPSSASPSSATTSDAAAVDLAPASAFTPTEVQAEMVRRLSLRDGSPPCSDVEAGSADPLQDLQAIVQHVELPPFVPMRAAECVIAKGDAAEGELTRWMTGADTKGLALLLSDRIDALPAPLATRVVTSGLGGPHADEVRARVVKSTLPEVRTLVGGAP